jgi:hypothetical protein
MAPRDGRPTLLDTALDRLLRLVDRARVHTTRPGLDHANADSDRTVHQLRVRADRRTARILTDALSYQPGLVDVRATALDICLYLSNLADVSNGQGQDRALTDALYQAAGAAGALADALTDAAYTTLPDPTPDPVPQPGFRIPLDTV